MNYDQLPDSIKLQVLEYFEDNPTCKTEDDVRQRWDGLSEDEQNDLLHYFGS